MKNLQRYLERHRFGNAHHTALWRALTEQAQEEKMNINVTTVMHNWTVAMGYPVITLLRSGDQILVNQEHFLLDRGIDNMTSVSKTLWHVPLTFVSNESATIDWDYQPIIWLSDQQSPFTFYLLFSSLFNSTDNLKTFYLRIIFLVTVYFLHFSKTGKFILKLRTSTKISEIFLMDQNIFNFFILKEKFLL